ncbi:hypothetical protein TIFTF001_028498 [Ficus carica]|uniref:Uncharacterized protein n=1 Tax=Ficus carica TaxID=3494 RepID=A0AA88DPW1_FICCA|nr:hypothetical protein TIFTF001_028498 [Ficus carica]
MKVMMASKLACVVPTRVRVCCVADVLVVLAERKLTFDVYAVACARRVVIEFGIRAVSCNPISQYDDMDPRRVEEDRYAAYAFNGMQPLLFDGTHRTASLSAWLYDMETIFHICHIEAHLQVSLACRCLVADARLWWMTLGERAMPDRTWVHFRTLVIVRFGPVPDEGADGLYRDPEIYRAMHLERYFSYVADWHAYPQESMGHYCRRFQEAMLPHIPQDIVSPGMQALVILRNGLPPQIRQHVPAPTPDMTVGHMIEYIMDAEVIVHAMQADTYVVEPQVPVDDAGIGEPMFEAGLAFSEDPIPVVPLQEVLAPEDEIEADDHDVDYDMDAPEDPPIIDISSDDEDDGEEPEYEPGYGGWIDEGDEFEDDPDEILYDDGDWDADSDASSVVTIEYID